MGRIYFEYKQIHDLPSNIRAERGKMFVLVISGYLKVQAILFNCGFVKL